MNGVAAMLSIFVNGEPRSVSDACTMSELLRDLGLAERKGIAVAVNGTVVPRGAWTARMLADGDRVLVIRATQGG